MRNVVRLEYTEIKYMVYDIWYTIYGIELVVLCPETSRSWP